MGFHLAIFIAVIEMEPVEVGAYRIDWRGGGGDICAPVSRVRIWAEVFSPGTGVFGGELFAPHPANVRLVNINRDNGFIRSPHQSDIIERSTLKEIGR